MCRAMLLLLLAAVPAQATDPLARYDAVIKPRDRAHWAYVPVRPVPVPRVKNSAWVRNPIDAFVLARLERQGWTPAQPVSRGAFLRRLSLDLTGLPPTLAEQDVFVKDRSPTALDRVVNALLTSPAHAERYARHWLDVARYADTNGYERDADKPGAWTYRDRVIRAFADDLPFDRFIIEQLAGDELEDATPDTIRATGFLRLGPWDDEPADPATDRYDQLDDMVATTGEAFLGLTIACARCHNHKFEAVSMHDYYRMVAIFNPLVRPRNGRTELDRPAVSYSRRSMFDADVLTLTRLKRLTVVGALVGSTAPREIATKVKSLESRLARVPRGYFMEERSPRAPKTHLLKRGRASSPGPEVQPGLPAVFVAKQPAFLAPGKETTRRRLTLAKWIASKDNPLTARVIVNRVWQWHFGEGLVRTPGDFGTRGEKPTHPELLDWLAGWFVDSGWSLRKLNRLIVTSSTYRMGKQWREECGDIDPETRFLWRFPYRRLDAEAIRDSMLAVSGQLNRAMFGPGVRPAIPKAALEGHSDPKTVWRPDPPEKANRRTIYVHVKRSLMVPLIEVLDFCDTTRSSSRRTITTVAPQALILFNGAFVNEQAKHLARRLRIEAGAKQEDQIALAYRLALSREPSRKEKEMLRLFLIRNPGEAGLVQVCRVVLNLNEFVYPD